MRKLALALVAIVLSGVVVPVATVSAAPPLMACPVGAEWDLLALVNAFRADNGKPALAMSHELNTKAQAWTQNMIAQDRLYHSTLSNGVSSGWSSISENVGYHSQGLAAVQDALEASPGHRTNLLSNVSEIGLGVGVDSRGRTWVTQVFVNRGVPTPVYRGPTGGTWYNSMNPAVLYDNTSSSPMAGGSSVTVQVTGVAGVPVGAAVGVVTLEALSPAGSGFVQALGVGSTVGTAANVNVSDGDAANTALVALDANGRFSVYSSVATWLRVTVTGFFMPVAGPVSAGRLQPLTPVRVLNTRNGTGYTGSRPVAGQTISAQVAGIGGVPASGATSVVLNVAHVQADGDGFVQVGAAPFTPGAWKNIHVNRAGQTIANMVIAPLDAQGRVSLYTSVGAHLIVDVQGWFTGPGAPANTNGIYIPIAATRALDTRNAIGVATTTPLSGQVGVGVPGKGDMPACPRAAMVNIAIIPTAATYAQVGPFNRFVGGTYSSVNADTANRAIANAAIVPTGQLSALGVYSPTATHMILDLAGWFN